MDAPRDLRVESHAHLMLGNSITDVVHENEMKRRDISKPNIMTNIFKEMLFI